MPVKLVPKKSLGQNFLANPRILDKIVAAAEITRKDTVLEIGPGTGNLTAKLVEKAGRVIAIEKDRRLIPILKNKFENQLNIEIIEGDILKIKLNDLRLTADNYKIVANIPYYITSNILRTIFEEWPRPEVIVLTIQKEVAQRITAEPPKMNLLAVSVQFFSELKIIGYISKENFRPRPKVDSAIIELAPKKESLNQEQTEMFFKLIKAGFSQKRKLLINNLADKLNIKKNDILKAFEKLGIKEKSRAEELNINNWLKLANIL